MSFWDRLWFGPVAAVRPYLFQKCFLLLIATDALVLMAERGSSYGLDSPPFNAAHFRWLDAVHTMVLPVGVPGATYYVCLLVITSFLAFCLFLVGHRPWLTAVLTMLYTYLWSMSRLDSYLHHYMITLILGCVTFFPAVDPRTLRQHMLDKCSSGVGRRSRSAAETDRSGWRLATGLALLAASYRVSLSRAVDLNSWQRWAAMFLACALLAFIVLRWQPRRQVGSGTLISAWAFRLLGFTVGVIYTFTSIAKMDAEWCGGYTIRQIGTTADVLQPIEQLAGVVGISPDWFWSILATFVIPLELALAISYLLAVWRDEPVGKWLPRWCSFAWLLAIGLHLNNEMMNLIIQWFGYYMLFLATTILLPARVLLTLGVVFIWPDAWLRDRWGRTLDSLSSSQATLLLLTSTGFALFVLILGGFFLALPGALVAGCVLAAGLVVLLVGGVLLGRERRSLGMSCTAATAGLLMIGVVSQCSMRFDYYDLRGKTLQQLGSHQMAVEEMGKAAALTPPSAAAAAELYHNLGVSEAQLGDLPAARKWYESALNVAPHHALAHYSLANLMIRQEQFELAERHYLAAIAAKTDFSDAYANLGHMLEFQGRWDEAIENYRRGLEIEPGAEDLRKMLEHAIRERN